MIVVIKNEQHKFFEEQVKFLDRLGPRTELLIPATGWSLEEIKKIFRGLRQDRGTKVVFASPVPAAMRVLGGIKWGVFHNDYREKKELPSGRIIQIVAKEGWKIVW